MEVWILKVTSKDCIFSKYAIVNSGYEKCEHVPKLTNVTTHKRAATPRPGETRFTCIKPLDKFTDGSYRVHVQQNRRLRVLRLIQLSREWRLLVASHFFTNNKQNRLFGLRPRAVADAATAYFNGTNHLNYRAKSIDSIDAIWVRFSQFLVVAGTVSIDWRRVEIGKTDLRAGRLDSAFSQLLVWRRRCRTAISSWVLL